MQIHIALFNDKELAAKLERAIDHIMSSYCDKALRDMCTIEGRAKPSKQSIIESLLKNQLEWLEDDGLIPRGK